jgi:hypothetical protein
MFDEFYNFNDISLDLKFERRSDKLEEILGVNF